MKVSVIVPDDYMGDVIGDLNSRRGQVQGMEPRNGATQIDAFVPLSAMFGYATDLRSRTPGSWPVYDEASATMRRFPSLWLKRLLPAAAEITDFSQRTEIAIAIPGSIGYNGE